MTQAMQAMQFAVAERESEQALVGLIAKRNISDGFTSGLSINSVAQRWRHFSSGRVDVIEGLSRTNLVVSEFFDWWAEKDKSVAIKRLDLSFVADVTAYVATQILYYKDAHGLIFDPQVRLAFQLTKLAREARGDIHEAINRAAKVHGVSDDGIKAICEAAEEAVERCWRRDREALS